MKNTVERRTEGRVKVMHKRHLVCCALLSLVLLASALPAIAQGCAMCYSTASAASKEGEQAITRGVVVLLLPPLSLMTVGVGLAFRYGRRRDHSQNGEAESGSPSRLS